MGDERYSAGEVAAALLASGGVMVAAAKLLGCSRAALRSFIERHPDLDDVREHAMESMLDIAESALMEKVRAGNLGAITFFLKTKGVNRGYNTRTELVSSAPVMQVYLPAPDPGDKPIMIEAKSAKEAAKKVAAATKK